MNSTLTVASILALQIFQKVGFAGDLNHGKGGADRSVVATLLETGSVRCVPSLRYFCANIHVGCAGRTKKKAFPFELRVKSGGGWIEPAGHADVDQYSLTAKLVTNAGGAYVILPLANDGGYVKLESSGKYSFRYYIRGAGVMSYGQCR